MGYVICNDNCEDKSPYHPVDYIQDGDIVHVNFNNSQFTLCNRARVLHIPCAVGDRWQFHDMKTGRIYHISEGCTVALIKKQNKCDDGKEIPF